MCILLVVSDSAGRRLRRGAGHDMESRRFGRVGFATAIWDEWVVVADVVGTALVTWVP